MYCREVSRFVIHVEKLVRNRTCGTLTVRLIRLILSCRAVSVSQRTLASLVTYVLVTGFALLTILLLVSC